MIFDILLVANIRIGDPEKLEMFKVTVRDAVMLFAEAHFKIRGSFAAAAVEFVRSVGFQRITFYQELTEDDWIVATRRIVDGLKSRSLFLFFEDHRLTAPPEALQAMANDFERLKLDYLVYSFFRASRLDSNNLLPFPTIETPNLSAFSAGPDELSLLGKISPGYYTYSLVSLVSVSYFTKLLATEDGRVKFYSKGMLGLFALIFGYPKYRRIYAGLNRILARAGIRCCIYDARSPFNLEKMWWESVMVGGRLAIGIPKQELFANYDDDNGAPGESLVKRGLYPFDTNATLPADLGSRRWVERTVHLNQGDAHGLHYHAAVGRISHPPIILIQVSKGQISLNCPNENVILKGGDSKALYANQGGEMKAIESASVVLRIYDELF